MANIGQCYVDARESLPEPLEVQDNKAKAKLIKLLRSSECIDLRDKSHKQKASRIKKARIFRSTVLGHDARIIPARVMTKLLPDVSVRKRVLGTFLRDGRLLPDADGKKSRSIQFGVAIDGGTRGYCFVRKTKKRKSKVP